MKVYSGIILFAIILTFASCSLFEDDKIENGNCQLIKSSYDIPNDPARGEVLYSYDANGRLISSESSEWDLGSTPYKTRTRINYAGDLVSDISSYNTFLNDPEEKEFDYNFFYENGKLDSVSFEGYNAYMNNDGYLLSEFDGDKLKSVKRYNYNSLLSSFIHYSSSTLTWSGNNVSSIETILISTSDTLRYNYEYDSMKSSINNFGYYFYSSQYYNLSENNVLKSDYYYNNTLQNTNNYSYSYTDQDYPATSQQLPDYPLYTHEYDCN